MDEMADRLFHHLDLGTALHGLAHAGTQVDGEDRHLAAAQRAVRGRVVALHQRAGQLPQAPDRHKPAVVRGLGDTAEQFRVKLIAKADRMDVDMGLITGPHGGKQERCLLVGRAVGEQPDLPVNASGNRL